MEGVSVVAQSKDDDQVRIEKLLAWAKSRHVWMHDDALIGNMVASSSNDGPSNAEALDDATEGDEGSEAEEDDNSYPDREKRAKGAGFSVYVKPGGRILERQVSECPTTKHYMLNADDLLVPVTLVPKSTLLSVRTSSLAPHIPTTMLFSSDATSGMLLALVLLHELLLGEQGSWWGYLQSLPRENGLWGVQLPYILSRESAGWRLMEHLEAGRMVKRAEADPMGRIEGLGLSLVRNMLYEVQAVC
jgi:hypothetical protein